MINTIVISEEATKAASLKKALNESDYNIIFEAGTIQQLLAMKLEQEPQLIIAILESTDSDVLSKFKVIIEQVPLPIVIFTHDHREDAIEQAVEAGISAYIVDGFSEERLLPILKMGMARFKQYQGMLNKVEELRTSLADRKIIDRAKGLIMQQRQCSEDEAYKLLRTSAMNQNMRLAKLAQNILSTANLLDSKKTV
jgi:response regulator NasT